MKHYFSFRRNDEDEYIRVYIVWGIKAADISDCDLKSSEFCRGSAVYDDTFNINTPEAQSAFKELCHNLEHMDAKLADELRIRQDITSGKLAISCFVKPLENYYRAQTQTSFGLQKYGSNLSLELPISPDNVTHFMNRNTFIYRNSLTRNFSNHLEILMSYWLTNGYTLQATPDYFKFNELVGEEKIAGITEYAYYSYSGLYYGTNLKYLAIEVNTTMNVYSLGYQEGLPIYMQWEELVNDMNKRMPPGVNGAFQVTDNLWHWLQVQETLANSALIGILVGLISAWVILILTTFNYVIGTLAVIIIALVTACVVGMIPLAGWKLGVLESLNLCMVVGLSVDYVVHLAEAYRMSTSYRRHDRVKDMLQSMGLSVISGAVTTIGAAVFMLFAQIQFFFQFGIFIISTIGTSLIFSLIGFTTFMSLCGPQGDTGSLMKAARECKLCVCGSQAKRDKTGKMKHEESKGFCEKYSPCSLVEKLFDRISYGK